MEFKHTNRGFELVTFKDRYDVPCSIQQSSLETEKALWIGCDDADPTVLASKANALGEPTERTVEWVAYPIPEEVLLNTRMHLTDDQVRELVSVLNMWLETGSLHKTSG